MHLAAKGFHRFILGAAAATIVDEVNSMQHRWRLLLSTLWAAASVMARDDCFGPDSKGAKPSGQILEAAAQRTPATFARLEKVRDRVSAVANPQPLSMGKPGEMLPAASNPREWENLAKALTTETPEANPKPTKRAGTRKKTVLASAPLLVPFEGPR